MNNTPKLILITPNILTEEYIFCIQTNIEYFNKLHIKTTANFDNLLLQLNKLTDNIPENHLNKIVVHINENSLSVFNHQNINTINEIENKILCIHQNYNITNFHFSEKFYENFGSSINPNIYHHYNISVSLHHLNLNETHNYFSYVLYGPLFPSISKYNYIPGKSMNQIQKELENIKNTTEIPVMAVGGIDDKNFIQAINIGFSGIAIRGHIWENQKPSDALTKFSEQWKKQIDR